MFFFLSPSAFFYGILEVISDGLTIRDIILDAIFTGELTLFSIALIIIIAPVVYIKRTLSGRFKSLSKLLPKQILTADEKNFEIPYHDIARISINKGKSLLRYSLVSPKIQILTNEEKHEFIFIFWVC